MFGSEFGGKPCKCFGESCMIGKSCTTKTMFAVFLLITCFMSVTLPIKQMDFEASLCNKRGCFARRCLFIIIPVRKALRLFTALLDNSKAIESP